MSLQGAVHLGKMQPTLDLCRCRSHAADFRVRTQQPLLQRAVSRAYELTYLFEGRGHRSPQVNWLYNHAQTLHAVPNIVLEPELHRNMVSSCDHCVQVMQYHEHPRLLWWFSMAHTTCAIRRVPPAVSHVWGRNVCATERIRFKRDHAAAACCTHQGGSVSCDQGDGA